MARMKGISETLDLGQLLLGNSLYDWLVAIVIATLMIAVWALIKRKGIDRLGRLTRRSQSIPLHALIEGLRATRLWLIVIFSVLFSAQYLDMTPRLEHILASIATITAFLQVGLWCNRALVYSVEQGRQRALITNASSATSISAMGFIGRMVLWLIVGLLMLENLGVDITALVAGLGVGGIAVALAVQNILGDLFASLSIVVDKPFVLGDFIIVDDYMGSVENIGLKTTRLRSLGGEQLVFSNSDLLKTRIRNYKRMYERRVVFGFNLVLETPPDKLEWAAHKVREIISEVENTRLDRAHFFGFGESYFTFEVVYYVLSPDYNIYMDIQQRINLAMLRAFEEKGVRLATPARSVYVAGLSDDDAALHRALRNTAS